MKKKLVWRLGKLPSVEELQSLVKDKIITQDEARDILFSQESEEDRDKKSLESEIKFLRELIEKLANSPSKIVETIKYVEPIYRSYPWYRPYAVWSSNDIVLCGTGTTSNLSSTRLANNAVNASFSTIKTF